MSESSREDLEEKFIDLLSFVPHHTPEHIQTGEKINEDAPLFSEAYLYNTLGKQDARTVLALINHILDEFDMERRELMRKVRLEREKEEISN